MCVPESEYWHTSSAHIWIAQWQAIRRVFSFDKPSSLIRDVELVKNILVKDSQNFKDRIISFNEKLDSLFSKSLLVTEGQRWPHLRTNLTPVFTSGKMKMFYLVDTCSKDLANCLHKATTDGKVFQSWAFHHFLFLNGKCGLRNP